jgi:hypothetical protein
MKFNNLIEESILKGNIFKIDANRTNNDILKNLIKLTILFALGSMIISKEYKKFAILFVSILIALYMLLNFKKKKIGSDMINQKGNNLIGKDEKLKEVEGDEKFYDTIQLHHNDLINKNIMDRNFYRLPNPRRIADQNKFAKWLYYQKSACKENNENCFKYETLNNR